MPATLPYQEVRLYRVKNLRECLVMIGRKRTGINCENESKPARQWVARSFLLALSVPIPVRCVEESDSGTVSLCDWFESIRFEGTDS